MAVKDWQEVWLTALLTYAGIGVSDLLGLPEWWGWILMAFTVAMIYYTVLHQLRTREKNRKYGP
jgi:hypothetical protein